MVIHLEKHKSTLFDIERIIGKTNHNKKRKKQPNHLVTIIKTNTNEVFLLDPTNPCECEIIKNWKLIELTGKYTINKKLLYNELEYWLYNNSPLREEETLSRERLIEDYNIAKELCKNRHNEFNDFYYENKENYESIKKLIITNK